MNYACHINCMRNAYVYEKGMPVWRSGDWVFLVPLNEQTNRTEPSQTKRFKMKRKSYAYIEISKYPFRRIYYYTAHICIVYMGYIQYM